MNIEMQRIEDYFQDVGLEVEEFSPQSSHRKPEVLVFNNGGERLEIGYKDAKSHMYNESTREEVLNDAYPIWLWI